MIIESIVTSMAADGTINFAPMGVEWGEPSLVLKPFLETTTFRNVRETRVAVVNITDDVMLFARAAISSPEYPWVPATMVRGAVLEAASMNFGCCGIPRRLHYFAGVGVAIST